MRGFGWGIQELHNFLTWADDSGAYQGRDYRLFAAETKRHIEGAG
jgi:hypothetical protein